MRKMLLRATIGAIPGLLLVVVPVLLHAAGAITSDQSQLAFTGLPLLFLGILIGVLSAAAEIGRGGRAAIGMLVGFIVGLVVGLALSAAVGPVLWLLTTPTAMIAGGVIAATIDGDHHHPRLV